MRRLRAHVGCLYRDFIHIAFPGSGNTLNSDRHPTNPSSSPAKQKRSRSLATDGFSDIHGLNPDTFAKEDIELNAPVQINGQK